MRSLAVASAALALLGFPLHAAAQPFSPTSSASFVLRADLAPVCSVEPLTLQPITMVPLAVETELGSIVYRCTVPNGFERRITSASNGFLFLPNGTPQDVTPFFLGGSGEFPLGFNLTQLGAGGLVNIIPDSPELRSANGLQQTLRVLVQNTPGLPAGVYQDDLIITILAQP